MKTVYWSPHLTMDMYAVNNLHYQEPVNLISEMVSQRNKENVGPVFYSCPAYLENRKNTFIIKNPFNYNITFPYDLDIYVKSPMPQPAKDRNTGEFVERWALTRPAARSDSFSIDLAMSWIFFSEEDLEMDTTPPYLHRPEYGKTAFYIPGKFNIGSWFRPVDMALQMWPNEKDLTSPIGDPLLYVNFNTEEKVILKRFYMTQEIYDISVACVRYKNYNPKTPLTKAYSVFKEAKIHKALIKMIKEAAVD